MKKLVAWVIIGCLFSGCTTHYTDSWCRQPEYREVNKVDCDQASTVEITRWAGIPWPVWVLASPVIVLAAAVGMGSSSSSHLTAGGSAATDYTLPQNQLQPLPYSQQQINNGNGGGRYGNYPQ